MNKYTLVLNFGAVARVDVFSGGTPVVGFMGQQLI